VRHINEIIIHCTATRKSWMQANSTSDKVSEIKRWHVEDNKWSDIGYHYVIDTDGTVALGRPVIRSGAHCRGRNRNSIGVTLIGGFGGEKHDEFSDHFTDEQDEALQLLIENLRDTHNISKVSGHSEYANKACPCFSVDDYITGTT